MNFMQYGVVNINPDTGIRYTVFSLNRLAIDDEVHEWPNPSNDKAFAEYCRDRLSQILYATTDPLHKELLEELGTTDFEEAEDALQELDDEDAGLLLETVDYPQVEHYFDGLDTELVGAQYDRDGVKAEIIELGGAYLLMVFESPFTARFRLCSPCVPNACDGDNPDAGGVIGYMVPADWLWSNEKES